MTLQLNPAQLKAIFEHAERIYPEECCGLLLGRSLSPDQDHPTDRQVIEIRETRNAWGAEAEASLAELSPHSGHQSLTKSRRYWIDPREMLDAQRYARDRQLDIIGVYHSHPDHPATPSECDRAAAWHHYSYMIVSVQHGRVKHVLSWTLDDDHQFQAEEIQTIVPLSV